MVARGEDGSTQSFPVVETIQKRSICHVVEAPAAVGPVTRAKAAATAEAAVQALEGPHPTVPTMPEVKTEPATIRRGAPCRGWPDAEAQVIQLVDIELLNRQ